MVVGAPERVDVGGVVVVVVGGGGGQIVPGAAAVGGDQRLVGGRVGSAGGPHSEVLLGVVAGAGRVVGVIVGVLKGGVVCTG